MSLILFDFDGVLADTLSDMLIFAQQVCDELGVNHSVTRGDLDSLETMSFAEYGRQLEVPEPLVDEFVRRCLKRFAEKDSPPAIFSGLEQVIRELCQNHTLAIVSGNTAANVQTFLATHGLEECFRAIFGVDSAGTKSEKIAHARGQWARRDEPVFMVGDSVSDIRSAREASVKSIAVGWGHQSVERLSSAKPDHLVRVPRELLGIISGVDIPDRLITLTELRRNSGERGTRKWIAHNGIVYDVTDCPKWRGDLHEQLHFPAQDLTSELPDAPHKEEVFQHDCVKIVGRLES